MKEKLAEIERQCQQKKKELEEINQKKEISSAFIPLPTPMSSLAMVKIPESSFFSSLGCSSTSVQPPSAMKFSTIPSLSPNFSSSSNSDTTTYIKLPKLSSDSDSSKFEDLETSSLGSASFSKRKGGIPKKHDDVIQTETIVAKKPKKLVEYILASKNRVAETNVKDSDQEKTMSSPSMKEELVNCSDATYKPQLKIVDMPRMANFDDENSKPADNYPVFGEKPYIFTKKSHHHKSSSSKHHSKHKKSRDKERKRRNSEKKRMDHKCRLTKEHLENDKIRVLTAMGGLFYAGHLSAVEAPDVYAITLDGERQNRPHIMSREEVLRDAVSAQKSFKTDFKIKKIKNHLLF
jgi:hypothetical protein